MASWWRKNVIEPVHSFRVPLPRAGQNLMTVVYICAPVVAGYYIMEWTNKEASRNLPAIQQSHQSKVGQLHVQHQRKQLEKMLNEHKPSKN
jgi:hypothetical protein|tara:strand:- start:120 stop:392 length:273 start_codon:yes stop_codon:yes gene_type:complete